MADNNNAQQLHNSSGSVGKQQNTPSQQHNAPWRTKSVDDIELGHLHGYVAHDHDSHASQYHDSEGASHDSHEELPLTGDELPRSRSVGVNVSTLLRQRI